MQIDDSFKVKFKYTLVEEEQRGRVLHKAINLLHDRHPHYSAKSIFFKLSVRATAVSILGILVSCIFFPTASVFAILATSNTLYTITMLFKVYIFTAGCVAGPIKPPEAKLVEQELPIYTILVPLYKEKRVLSQLVESIEHIDYPQDKLDVKIILEEDDSETILAALEIIKNPIFDIIVVPDALPKTKPKALNYAMDFAKGELVTIYDAEDIPDPYQLKKAAIALKNDDVACVQARLDFYNANTNLLTKLFSIEYKTWFGFFLRGLEHINAPMPLGGTSNHFKREALEKVLFWDPYNVTEDADLGIKLAISGYKIKNLDSITMEECPKDIGQWLLQRTRWIKGMIQTYIVYMRSPRKLIKQTGIKGFMSLQLFIGAPAFTFLVTPLLILVWLFFSMSMLPDSVNIPPLFVDWWYFNLVLGVVYPIVTSVIASAYSIKSCGFMGIISIICYPYYFLLHSIASYRALYQMFNRPYYWDKTSHGE
jgi:glycosyltransferase XagB